MLFGYIFQIYIYGKCNYDTPSGSISRNNITVRLLATVIIVQDVFFFLSPLPECAFLLCIFILSLFTNLILQCLHLTIVRLLLLSLSSFSFSFSFLLKRRIGSLNI